MLALGSSPDSEVGHQAKVKVLTKTCHLLPLTVFFFKGKSFLQVNMEGCGEEIGCPAANAEANKSEQLRMLTMDPVFQTSLPKPLVSSELYTQLC